MRIVVIGGRGFLGARAVLPSALVRMRWLLALMRLRLYFSFLRRLVLRSFGTSVGPTLALKRAELQPALAIETRGFTFAGAS